MATARSLKLAVVFESLGNRNFRWFWLGRLASSATIEMGTVAQGWLAYQLTGSALALGSVAAGRSVARLGLSLYGGALADRFDRRSLLIATRAGMLGLSLLISVLVILDVVQVWHLVAHSFLSGVISSFMMPAQKAFLAQLVDRKTLLNAVSLTSVGMGLMGIIGASGAGFLIAWLGVEGVYLFIAVMYAYSLYTLTRLSKTEMGPGTGASVWADLSQGVRYLRCQPIILPLLGIAVIRALLGWSYRTLMPVYAEEVLQFDARGLGILSAAPSVGSLIASMGLASMGDFRGKGKALLLAGVTMGIALVGFSNTAHFGWVLIFLVITGAARNTTIITNQTLIQINTEPAYRGRIMSMYMMAMGLLPLGTIPAGAIADAMGVPFALTIQGALMAAIFALFWLARSSVRDLA